ncbi:MAG: RluA family pseudouridine synthase [Bacteroidota bacterium]
MAKKLAFADLIIWEDDDYAIINKPPFISTLQDRQIDYNILSLAKTYNADAQIGHRLDKETSGALVVAKNPDAYRHISMQFEHREVIKEYHAVVDGIHSFKKKLVNDRILQLSNGTVRIDRKGKDAETVFNTLRAYRNHSLVQCRPVTGRMHQIRIHLAKNGAPITGDEKYGGKPFYLSSVKRGYRAGKWDEEQPLIKRLALHAKSIAFKTLNGTVKKVEADYPKDFRVLLLQLEKNS